MGPSAAADAKPRAGTNVRAAAPAGTSRRSWRRVLRSIPEARAISRSSRLHARPLGAFEYERGQGAAGQRAGIDADAVALQIGPRGDGVAVHDDLAVFRLGLEKLVANPQHVFLDLLLEGKARTNAGMDEEVVAFAMG